MDGGFVLSLNGTVVAQTRFNDIRGGRRALTAVVHWRNGWDREICTLVGTPGLMMNLRSLDELTIDVVPKLDQSFVQPVPARLLHERDAARPAGIRIEAYLNGEFQDQVSSATSLTACCYWVESSAPSSGPEGSLRELELSDENAGTKRLPFFPGDVISLRLVPLRLQTDPAKRRELVGVKPYVPH